jgi:hypothetical protein
MGDWDTVSLFLSLPDSIFISSVRATTTELVVHIACQRSCAACPVCQQISERIHGTSVRTVADLPSAGRRVILRLSVRKFVCSVPSCLRQIFTERLPDLVQSYARMTNRLREAASRTRFGHQRRGERAAGPTAFDARFGSHAASSSAGDRLPASKVGPHSWRG